MDRSQKAPTPSHRPRQILLAFQRFIQQRGGRCSFLQSRVVPGDEPGSDVDMAIDRVALARLSGVFGDLRREHGMRLLQLIQWDSPFGGYFVLAYAADEPLGFVRPDLSCDPVGEGDNVLAGEMLVSRTVERDGFCHLAPEVEWAYQLLKRLRKGSISDEQLAHLRKLQHESDGAARGEIVSAYFPRKLIDRYEAAIAVCDKPALFDRALRSKTVVFSRRLRRPGRFAQPAMELSRIGSRLIAPPGAAIGLWVNDLTAGGRVAGDLAEDLRPVFRGRTHIEVLPPSRRWRMRPRSLSWSLARGTLDISVAQAGRHHASRKALRSANGRVWFDVGSRNMEAVREQVLHWLEERMRQRGWLQDGAPGVAK